MEKIYKGGKGEGNGEDIRGERWKGMEKIYGRKGGREWRRYKEGKGKGNSENIKGKGERDCVGLRGRIEKEGTKYLEN